MVVLDNYLPCISQEKEITFVIIKQVSTNSLYYGVLVIQIKSQSEYPDDLQTVGCYSTTG